VLQEFYGSTGGAFIQQVPEMATYTGQGSSSSKNEWFRGRSTGGIGAEAAGTNSSNFKDITFW
jgi:hypothetical protein